MHDGDSKYQLLLFSCVPRVLVKSDLANPNLDRNLPETLAAALSSLASSSPAHREYIGIEVTNKAPMDQILLMTFIHPTHCCYYF